ncbi:MAG: RluA family pseudouridine synthase [Candidatus Omnitrophica bacterium]|nr:RluA family pseudouridine synthase [Candidatus Omnitrophota bacterium]
MKAPRIIYEDEKLIIADKPAGILTIPAPKKENNTLTDLLNHELDRRGVEVNAYPCHRLDCETSGVIIYAKGKSAQQAMMDKFRLREVRKTYIAFVNGRLKKDFGAVTAPIYNRNRRRKEEAVTKYRVLKRHPLFTEIEAEPVTGRTNQIRIHMKAIGHPLVGESVYAFRRDFKLRFRRAALHAKRIEFTHPASGEKLSFESPLPADMTDFIKKYN